ncbi:DNA-3-methyladenine glycosylase 2 [Mangrovibacter yixingensis]|uniref:DNA-3-methyladenine glycosylase 2 n=1 Tax=Mangrovibacter yixingensis TaxID=1529639 RepID=UPI00299EF31F|nr:DNA-3-methyladenine glycosylase 2 [Mangrovibacter yixingensis]
MLPATPDEITGKENNLFFLQYQPPYDWEWMRQFLAARAVGGLESVTQESFSRVMVIGGVTGLVVARPEPQHNRLQVALSASLVPAAETVLARVRHWLNLGLNPEEVNQVLGPLAALNPGIRMPGCICPFEQMVRAVLGQLVSVKMAAQLATRLVQAFGTASAHGQLFPQAEVLAGCDPQAVKSIGMSLRRAETIITLAQSVVAGEFPLTPPEDTSAGLKHLMSWPGIGRWTASYFALRGWGAQDVFLEDDYLIKQRFAGMTPGQIRQYAQRWAPWRSLALLHIWNNAGWQPELS